MLFCLCDAGFGYVHLEKKPANGVDTAAATFSTAASTFVVKTVCMVSPCVCTLMLIYLLIISLLSEIGPSQVLGSSITLVDRTFCLEVFTPSHQNWRMVRTQLIHRFHVNWCAICCCC